MRNLYVYIVQCSNSSTVSNVCMYYHLFCNNAVAQNLNAVLLAIRFYNKFLVDKISLFTMKIEMLSASHGAFVTLIYRRV